METKALKAKRPGFTDERYMETAYFVENGEFLCDAAGITQPFIKIYRISWEPKIFPASVTAVISHTTPPLLNLQRPPTSWVTKLAN